MNLLLDSDVAAGTNVSTDLAIDASLKRLDSSLENMPKEIMHGLCTDAGGGGTREVLANTMMKLGRAAASNTFLKTTCAHHGFNLMTASPCEKYFGDGGMKKEI